MDKSGRLCAPGISRRFADTINAPTENGSDGTDAALGKGQAVLQSTRRRGLRGLLPPQSTWFLLFLAFLVNVVAYYSAPAINAGRTHYSVQLTLDGMIPLSTPFIALYLLAYVQWAVSYLFVARDDRALFRRVVWGDIIAKLLAFALFILIPTTMTRPTIAGDGIFDRITAFIYRIDKPENLFPSIHCLESWMACRAGFRLKRVPGWYKWACMVFTLLVFAATLLVKQHVLADVLGGIAVVEIGLWCSGRLLKRRWRA